MNKKEDKGTVRNPSRENIQHEREELDKKKSELDEKEAQLDREEGKPPSNTKPGIGRAFGSKKHR